MSINKDYLFAWQLSKRGILLCRVFIQSQSTVISIDCGIYDRNCIRGLTRMNRSIDCAVAAFSIITGIIFSPLLYIYGIPQYCVYKYLEFNYTPFLNVFGPRANLAITRLGRTIIQTIKSSTPDCNI